MEGQIFILHKPSGTRTCSIYLCMVVQLSTKEIAACSLVGQDQEQARTSFFCDLPHQGEWRQSREGSERQFVVVLPRIKALRAGPEKYQEGHECRAERYLCPGQTTPVDAAEQQDGPEHVPEEETKPRHRNMTVDSIVTVHPVKVTK